MAIRWPTPRPIHLLHIPKTAGTSVTSWLSRAAGPAAVCPAKNWDQLVALGRPPLAGYRVFCGHYGIGLEAYLGRRLRTCTILRDPVERTISHYRHVHRDTAHPRHRAVSSQSFGEFLQDPENLPMIDNFQARYLTESPLDLRGYVGRLDPSAVKANRLSTTSEEVRYLLEPAYVRERALANLDRIEVVGVTDRVRRFLAGLERAFGPFADGDAADVPIENAAPDAVATDTGDPAALVLVRTLTRIDQELYDRACRRLDAVGRAGP